MRSFALPIYYLNSAQNVESLARCILGTSLNSIELFAGAGGLGMGLQKAGFSPRQVIEWDRHCCNTLKANIAAGKNAVHGWDVVHEDVRNVDFSPFSGSIDLVSGGPPCQPFSLGGRHKAHDDARDMFPQAIRAIREIGPPAFIFENVKGLQRSAFRNYLEYIRLQMTYPEIVKSGNDDWQIHLAQLEQHHSSNSTSGLSYRVVFQVIDAADFGVPQRRERMFFVGFREDLHVRWSFPLPTHSKDALIWDQQAGSYWERHEMRKPSPLMSNDIRPSPFLPWRTVRDAIADLPNPTAEHGIVGHDFRPGARTYRGHTGSSLDLPSKTLKAGVHGVPGGENMFIQDDGAVRYFTIRECARLQTFPDEFEFHGSWSESIRQVGNAVPVEIATILGQNIAKSIQKSTGTN